MNSNLREKYSQKTQERKGQSSKSKSLAISFGERFLSQFWKLFLLVSLVPMLLIVTYYINLQTLKAEIDSSYVSMIEDMIKKEDVSIPQLQESFVGKDMTDEEVEYVETFINNYTNPQKKVVNLFIIYIVMVGFLFVLREYLKKERKNGKK